MKPWLPALLIVLAPLVTGCADDATRAPSEVASLPTATALSSALPTGWPGELQLPADSTVNDSADRAGMLSVSFETQALAASVSRFLARELTGAGWARGARRTEPGGAVTTAWTKDSRDLELVVDDTGTTTEATIRILDPATPSASADGG